MELVQNEKYIYNALRAGNEFLSWSAGGWGGWGGCLEGF